MHRRVSHCIFERQEGVLRDIAMEVLTLWAVLPLILLGIVGDTVLEALVRIGLLLVSK